MTRRAICGGPHLAARKFVKVGVNLGASGRGGF
jgi:hypothetical protein